VQELAQARVQEQHTIHVGEEVLLQGQHDHK
jgi:hypothetical protein